MSHVLVSSRLFERCVIATNELSLKQIKTTKTYLLKRGKELCREVGGGGGGKQAVPLLGLLPDSKFKWRLGTSFSIFI